MQTAFPDYSVRRAFTSQIIIDHVKDRDGVTIDNVEQALERAVNNGVKTLVVQPTHLMNGLEYEELADEVGQVFRQPSIRLPSATPLLTSDADLRGRHDQAITDATRDARRRQDRHLLHGPRHHGRLQLRCISKMQTLLTDKGFNDYYVGTVEAHPLPGRCAGCRAEGQL